jgi:hypothetical protein
LGWVLLGLPAVTQGQFTFTTNNGAITITRYTGSDAMVIIPPLTNGYPVTRIGDSAFMNCSGVTNVIIPDSVTNIDVQAFTGCGLTSVTIPNSVTTIAQSAFLSCLGLASLTIGYSVVSIGDDAFYGCSSLTNIFVPKSVTNLNSTALNHCSSLTSITVDAQNPAYSSVAGVLLDKDQTLLVDYPGGLVGSYLIPGSVTSIGGFAFLFCTGLTSVTIPDNVTNIGEYAFYGCTLTNVSLPTNLVNIGQYAFSGCVGLTSISMPDAVTTIGGNAFSRTGLASITIPDSVTNIGLEAFDCYTLTAINVDANNPVYSSVAGVLYDIGQTKLIDYPVGKSGNSFRRGTYAISNGVIGIGDGAFADCYLTNITIPESVTSIGGRAFDGCTLQTLVIPDSVTNIGNYALERTELTSITFPQSLTTLGWLGYCPRLRSIYFKGNAPGLPAGTGEVIWSGLQNVTAYYLPGAAGWDTYFQAIIPTTLWLPQVQVGDGRLGVTNNRFGFNIQWTSNQSVVVEACTNLSKPDWQPVQTNIITGDFFYFSDSTWMNYTGRFYRLRSP